MERYCQKGHESLQHQGGMGHWQGEMERSLQDGEGDVEKR